MSLLVLGHRFYRQACLLPGLESSTQRVHLGETALLQLPRHTGAGLFAASSTVGHERSITRQTL